MTSNRSGCSWKVFCNFFAVFFLALFLAVAFSGPAAAQQAKLAGSLIQMGGDWQQPWGIAVGVRGNIYVADYVGIVNRFAPSCTAEAYASGPLCKTTLAQTLGAGKPYWTPVGIAVDSSQDVYVLDGGTPSSGDGAVWRIPGSCVNTNPGVNCGTDSLVKMIPGLQDPYGMAIDSARNLYIVNRGNTSPSPSSPGVYKYTYNPGLDSYAPGLLVTGYTWNCPLAIAVDGANNAYVADHSGPGCGGSMQIKMAKYNPGGGAGGGNYNMPVLLASPGNGAWGLAADAAGNLYVGTSVIGGGGGTVVMYSASNLASSNPGGYPPVTLISGIGAGSGFNGIAVDNNSGSLYATDYMNHRVLKLNGQVIDFGSVPVKTTTPPRATLTFVFTAGGYLGATPYQAVTQGLPGYDFQPAPTQASTVCNSTTNYAIGDTCTVDVVFNPTAVSPRAGAVVLYNTSGAPVGTALIHGVGLGPVVQLNPAIITTVVGTGGTCAGSTNFTSGTACGDKGAAISATINQPRGLATDPAVHLYFTDQGNFVVRRVDAQDGTISTIAGTGTACASGTNFTSGTACGDGGLATAARFGNPSGITIDGVGNFYISDYQNSVVRKIDAVTGKISTVAGTGTASSTGDNGAATSATINQPQDVTSDGAGNLYVVDAGGNRVRKVNLLSGIITTVAGNGTACPVGTNFTTGTACGDGGAATSATLNFGTNGTVVLDSAGNLYIADFNNSVVRKVDTTGTISTVAGTGTNCTAYSSATNYCDDNSQATAARLGQPIAVALDAAGDIYITDRTNSIVRKVDTTGKITTLAGTGVASSTGDGGLATSATINIPNGIAFDYVGGLYIADYKGLRVRKLDFNKSMVTFPTQTQIGGVDPNSDATPQTVSITNIGNMDLTFPLPSADSNPSVTPDFSFVTPASGTPCSILTAFSSPYSLAGGEPCNYAFEFNPTVAGTISGEAVLTNNNINQTSPYATQSIQLKGTGKQGHPTLTLTVSPDTVTVAADETVTLTAQLSGLASTTAPVGTVTFSGSGVVGTLTCKPDASGMCTATYKPSGTLMTGSYSVVADYSDDDPNYAPATSDAEPLTVITPSPTTTVVTSSSLNPSLTTTPGGGVTFTATVTNTSGLFSPGERGTVTITATNGTSTVSCTTSGSPSRTILTASCAPSDPMDTAGIYTVTAVYSGDDLNAGSISAPFYQSVNDDGCSGNNFGQVNVGQSRTCVVTMPVTGQFGSGGLKVVTQGAELLDYTEAATTCDPNVVYDSSGSCMVAVTFTPKYAGQRMGAVVLFPEDTSGGGSTECDDPFGCDSGDGKGSDPTGSGILLNAMGTAYIQGTGMAPQITFNTVPVKTLLNSGLFFGAAGGDVAVDAAGNVYVADVINGVVKEIPASCISDGVANPSCVVTLGGAGTYTPMGVAVDGAGNVYVTDYDDGRYGQYVWKIPAGCTSDLYNAGSCTLTAMGGSPPTSGSYNCVTGGFCGPAGVAVDGVGNIYVGDQGNAVKKLTPGCTSASCMTTLGGGWGTTYAVAADGAGNVYVAEYKSSGATNTIKKISSDCTTDLYTAGSCTITALGGGFVNNTSRLAVDGVGNIYVSDRSLGVVKVLSPDCTSDLYNAGSCKILTLGGSWGSNAGIAVDGAGNVYVANSENAANSAVKMLPRATPPTVYFPNTLITQTSLSSNVPKYVEAQNIGNMPLTLTSPVGAGGNPEITSSPGALVSFAWDSANMSVAPKLCGDALSPLNPFALCDLAFTFKPTVPLLINGNARLSDDSLNQAPAMQNIPLQGTGLAPVITLSSLPNGSVGVAYDNTVLAQDSVAPYTFAVTSGSLPDGLTLSSSGRLMGTPASAGVYNFTVTATDSLSPDYSGPYTGSQAYTVIIDQVTLQSTANPATPSAGADIIATLAPSSSVTTYTPSGTISFADGDTPITGCINLPVASDMTSTCTLPTPLTAGVHNISATYSGDTNYIQATGTIPQLVNDALCGAHYFGKVPVNQGL
ncbi:MAG: Ig-like domain repeat protein, partial [Acidobacteriaceae bacterium]|nr:Ig-like domain repeat protein [Acidobacteriaceae bacterium]